MCCQNSMNINYAICDDDKKMWHTHTHTYDSGKVKSAYGLMNALQLGSFAAMASGDNSCVCSWNWVIFNDILHNLPHAAEEKWSEFMLQLRKLMIFFCFMRLWSWFVQRSWVHVLEALLFSIITFWNGFLFKWVSIDCRVYYEENGVNFGSLEFICKVCGIHFSIVNWPYCNIAQCVRLSMPSWNWHKKWPLVGFLFALFRGKKVCITMLYESIIQCVRPPVCDCASLQNPK